MSKLRSIIRSSRVKFRFSYIFHILRNPVMLVEVLVLVVMVDVMNVVMVATLLVGRAEHHRIL